VALLVVSVAALLLSMYNLLRKIPNHIYIIEKNYIKIQGPISPYYLICSSVSGHVKVSLTAARANDKT
jgi:hypothetical protein